MLPARAHKGTRNLHETAAAPSLAPRATTTGEPRALLTGIIALAFTMNMVGRGMSETFAVFLKPVEAGLNASRPDVTAAYSIFMLVLGLSGPVAGQVFDRLGARASYCGGLLVLGAGYYLAGSATAMWQYYLCFGVLGGIGVAALGMVSASGLLSRWFTNRLGTVMGFAYAAMGVGVQLLAPLTQVLISTYGWRDAYHLLGGAMVIIAAVLVVMPLTRMWRGSQAWRTKRLSPEAAHQSWDLAAAVRTPAFWALFFVYIFTSGAAYSVMPQAVAFLIEQGFNPLTAASIFGLAGALSIAGNFSIGLLADRFGRRPMVTLSYLGTIFGIISLMLVAWQPMLVFAYGWVFLFGTNQGTRGPIITTLVAILFAGGGVSRIYGAVTLGMGLGAAIGSWASGYLQKATGGYIASFTMAAVMAALGLAMFYVVPALGAQRLAAGAQRAGAKT